MGKKFVSDIEPAPSELTPGDVWESEESSTPFRKVWTGPAMGWSDAAVPKGVKGDEEEHMNEALEEVEDFKVVGTEGDEDPSEEEEELEENDDGSDETEVSDSDGKQDSDDPADDDAKLSEGRKSSTKKSPKKKSRR